ncbi:MAG: hypothetical protein Q7T76_14330 [Ferruginibacter sp.]|nr:hypothetical protein [Ferruginibacter sp.]
MTTTAFIRQSMTRLFKFRFLILATGLVCALLLFFYAKSKRPMYMAKATVFPLSNASENGLNTNTLSGLLGLGETPKSFSNEAAINIIELAMSRFVRESVAATPLPEFGNKTIGYLMVNDANQHKPLFEKEVKFPTDSSAQAVLGGELLRPGIVAKLSKNGMLELYYANADKKLVTPISYVLIDKISQFYIDLKIRKARADYNFTVRKIDSLDAIIDNVDRKSVRLQNTTLFAPDRLEFDIPRDRINSDKARFVKQRDISLNNQEEALWRLQKLTPIISVLDKPTEPFEVKKPSYLLFTLGGLVGGLVLSALLSIGGLIFSYAKSEIQASVFGDEQPTVTK